jgi:membrane fusion protein (multidrug efflux system)
MLVQASFPNPEGLLRPGQFGKIKARVDVVEDGILIPQRCVTELQGFYSVFVVDGSNRIKRKEVKVGPRIKQFWLVTEGLKSGERVVYEGLQKVKDGAIVRPVVKDIKLADEERE